MGKFKAIFKVQGVVYLLGAVLLVYFGISAPEIVDDFNIYWMMTFAASLLGILLLLGRGGENSAVVLSRIVVGGLFIVSGLIKANDTIGFAFKLEEYFRCYGCSQMRNHPDRINHHFYCALETISYRLQQPSYLTCCFNHLKMFLLLILKDFAMQI